METGISGRCWLRLSLGVFKTRAAAVCSQRQGTPQPLWVWGRLVTGLEAGAPSATAELGAGRR